jgi:lysyl-tRNA synthetase class I
MRNWISSEHFPDEYRIEIQTELTDEAKNSFNEGDLKYLIALRDTFNECEWKSDEINNHICNLARDNGMDLRNSFVILYNIHLGRPHGPRLASVLAEIPRDTVIDALTNAIKSLD